MVDFVKISTRQVKQGITEIFPKFKVKKSSDLMIRGGDFYAVWIEELGLWSTDEQDVIDIVDNELELEYTKLRQTSNDSLIVKYLWDSGSGSIDAWHKYCQKQMRDNYHPLDERLIFSNVETKKSDYASKKLCYPLEEGDYPGYEKLMSTLYSPTERQKIEWAIGAIIAGASKNIQKFLVLYGEAGTGKSTVINIIQKLFEGYYSVFDAKALGSSSNSFALEAFKTNPLIAIQHDGDLSRIEDNTRLNSLVSHELMTVNEKFKSAYSNKFNAFLIMGTNKPVKITDSKSGLLRRLIDVKPSGNKLDFVEYTEAVNKIDFELGAIAYHCHQVYLNNPNAYDKYVPTLMMSATNDFYNFIVDSFRVFKKNDGTTLKTAWEMYKTYCDDAKVPYPYSQRVFKEELKNYFWTFDGGFSEDSKVRDRYIGFRLDKFETEESVSSNGKVIKSKNWLEFKEGVPSVFDSLCAEYPAQYASSNEVPSKAWTKVHTKLSDLDTSKLHYVKIPETHIVIDFDIKDENGNKSFEKNLEAASKWPKTYAELSKSGGGIHLHYIYTGDPSLLSRVYDKDIEIKVFSGNSSLRRKLTKCNEENIATISSGLPLKEGKKKVINITGFKNEQAIRTMIKKNIAKEFHGNTRNLGAGYVSGVLAKVASAYAAGYAVGAAGARGINDGQKSHSPSKLAEQSGKWLGQGLVIGITGMTKKVYSTGYGMGETGVQAISDAIAHVSDIITGDMDSTPTITPVIDLTNVKNQANSISGMFNDANIGAEMNIRAIGSMMRENRQNGTNDDVVYAINKLRKDLGNVGNTYNSVNGVTYENGTEVSDAVSSLARALRIEGRR